MSDLVAFLRACLDEEQLGAEEAAKWDAEDGGGHHPRWKAAHGTIVDADSDDYGIVAPFLGETTPEVADHIARHDPARVLREVEAKRAILDEHDPGYPVTYPKPSGQPTCGVCHAGGWDWEPEKWPCATVRHLAAVYRDRPGYDPAWAPEGKEAR